MSSAWPPASAPNHSRYERLANSSSPCGTDSTDTDASSPSSTVVKRSCDADSWSRMRLASVMLVIDVIQPVCWPRGSISGETYMRASNSEPSLRITRTSMPPAGLRPLSSCCSSRSISSTRSCGQYGNGGARPTSEFSENPVIAQNAALT